MYRFTSAALAAVIGVAVIGTASAQTTPPATSPPGMSSQSKDTAAPMPGANSFTEAQAKDRMEKAGFTQIVNLKKDDQGIWRAAAMQSGKQVRVAVDFQGNVVATQ